MLNILARATRSSCRSWAQSAQWLRPYASFTVRDILNETSDEVGTLLIRFAKHIAIDGQSSAPLLPTTIRYSDYFPITELHYFRKQLKGTAADQLPALLFFCSTYRSNAEPKKFAEILNDIDRRAVLLLDSMDAHTALKILYAFLYLIPNWITRTDFYRAALPQLVNEYAANDDKDKFVQICFYLGLEKKRGPDQSLKPMLQQILQEHLERHLSELTTMDLAMVCSPAYKTATSVASSKYEEKLVAEILALPLEGHGYDALMVNFIKAMRFQRMRSEAVCKHLATLCRNPNVLRQLQAQGLVHVFAYFAENLWDEPIANAALMTEFMQRLCGQSKQFHSHLTVRAKDISMFLWCCAQLNGSFDSSDLEEIEAVIMKKVRNDEFRFFADQLVDACLSLWTLGHKSQPLLEEAIYRKEQAVQHRKQTGRGQPKVDSRLAVLQSAASIEEPSWLPNNKGSALTFDKPAPAYLLKNRTDLTEFAKKLSSEPAVSQVKLVSPISEINIPSLLVSFTDDDAEETQVLIELLTDEQILHFSKDPNGLVGLKIRLLNTLGLKVAVLKPSDLTENYTNLKDLIFEPDSLEPPKEQTVHIN